MNCIIDSTSCSNMKNSTSGSSCLGKNLKSPLIGISKLPDGSEVAAMADSPGHVLTRPSGCLLSVSPTPQFIFQLDLLL